MREPSGEGDSGSLKAGGCVRVGGALLQASLAPPWPPLPAQLMAPPFPYPGTMTSCTTPCLCAKPVTPSPMGRMPSLPALTSTLPTAPTPSRLCSSAPTAASTSRCWPGLWAGHPRGWEGMMGKAGVQADGRAGVGAELSCGWSVN